MDRGIHGVLVIGYLFTEASRRVDFDEFAFSWITALLVLAASPYM